MGIDDRYRQGTIVAATGANASRDADFDELDTNGDGVISRDEFTGWQHSEPSPGLRAYLAQLSNSELDELLTISHSLERRETQQVLGKEGASRDHALAEALIGKSQRRTVHVLRGGGMEADFSPATPGMSAEASRLEAESRERQGRLDEIRREAEMLRSKISSAAGSSYALGQGMLYGSQRRPCRITGIRSHLGEPTIYSVVLTEGGAEPIDAVEEELIPRGVPPYTSASQASIGGYWSPVKAPEARAPEAEFHSGRRLGLS